MHEHGIPDNLVCLLNLIYNMGIVHPRSTNKQITLFVIWNWYWTKLDIATSWKPKKIPFFNMGTSWKKFETLVFSNFIRNQPTFLEEYKVFLKAPICDVLMVESLLRVDPTQSNVGNPIGLRLGRRKKIHKSQLYCRWFAECKWMTKLGWQMREEWRKISGTK